MRKLIISIFTMLLVLASFVTSTFAFIVIQQSVELDEINFDVETNKGLLISTDGVNFSQDISSSMLVEAIEKQSGVTYGSQKFGNVSLKHDQDGKAVYDENGYLEFKTDEISRASTGVYSHYYKDASKAEYTSFDLWFKVIDTDPNETNDYTLSLMDTTSVKGTPYDVRLENKLNTTESQYSSGDTITVNPADAMRVGFVFDDKLQVYEPSIGLGSTALTSAFDDADKPLNDPNKNAMYTYYNNINTLYPFKDSSNNYFASEDGEGVIDTLKNFTDGDFGKFHYDSVKGEFNVIKLTVYIWLEGWDADYFMGIPANDVKINLGFTIL